MCTLCQIFGLPLHGAAALGASEVSGFEASETEASTFPPVGAAMLATGNPDIDGVLSGYKWSGAITYSFPTSASAYPAGYGSGEPLQTFSALSSTEQTLVHSIMDQASSFTNLTILFAGSGTADIRLAHSSLSNPTAYAYYPGANEGGDIWFGTSYNYTQPRTGDYSTLIHYHEIGHALGLKHSQEYGGVANIPVPKAHESLEYTVMSYHSWSGSPTYGYTNEQYGYPTTFMMNDIAALQAMYGADFSLNSSNTVYSWNPITGQMSIDGIGQALPVTNRVFLTIWDGGGNDTYDLSNYSTAVSIDLNPGGYTVTATKQLANLGSGHYASGNVYNAYLYQGDQRSYIENAIGGSGNDTLYGNAAANHLTGGAGNDIFNGRGGNDVFVLGSGADTIYFDRDFGVDLISDFNAAQDTISFSGITQLRTYSDLLGYASQIGSNTVITIEPDEILTLQGVSLESLTSWNFQFQQAAPIPVSVIEIVAGTPVAVINGTFASSSIQAAPPNVIITTSDGVSSYTDLDRIKFSDALVAMDIDGSAGLAYRLYQAAFDRTPDKIGLSSNIFLLDTKLDYLQMSAAFVASSEFQGTYGPLTNQQFVETLYQNVLHRAADPSGLAGWVTALNTNQADRASVLIGFSESTENHAAVDPTIAMGIVLDPHYFT